jgi:HTH-type transcriptional regulator/antitoxin HigA
MSPGEAIREIITKKGWTQTDLSQVLGKPLAALNEVVQGKRRITLDMAIALSTALGNTPEYWMNLDAIHRMLLDRLPNE